MMPALITAGLALALTTLLVVIKPGGSHGKSILPELIWSIVLASVAVYGFYHNHYWLPALVVAFYGIVVFNVVKSRFS